MRADDNASVAAIWIADAAPFFWYSDGTGPVFDLVLVCFKCVLSVY